MRELTTKEMEQVDGGFGIPGAIIGAGLAGVTSIASGDSAGQVVASMGFGMMTGFYGGWAATGGLQAGYRIGSSAMGIASAYLNGRADRAFSSNS